MIKVTHKKLMPVTGLSLDQQKRYGVRLFSIDHEAGLGRGAEREFSVDEGFTIYLMGVLVEGYKFGAEEAASHATAIFYAMTGSKPVAIWGDEIPENIEQLIQAYPNLIPSAWWGREEMIPNVVMKIHPGKGYEIRFYPPEEDPQDFEYDGDIEEHYKRRWIPSPSKGRRVRGVEATINLTDLLKHYIQGLRTQTS